MTDYITCSDEQQFEELHTIARKVIGGYPRTVGATAWVTPPDALGDNGVPMHVGGGRHAAATIVCHVSVEVDPKTAQLLLRVTDQLVTALAIESAADAKDKVLTTVEKTIIDAAIATAAPKVTKS